MDSGTGQATHLHHQDMITEAQVTGPLRVDITTENVSGLALGGTHMAELLSPLAMVALWLFPDYT